MAGGSDIDLQPIVDTDRDPMPPGLHRPDFVTVWGGQTVSFSDWNAVDPDPRLPQTALQVQLNHLPPPGLRERYIPLIPRGANVFIRACEIALIGGCGLGSVPTLIGRSGELDAVGKFVFIPLPFDTVVIRIQLKTPFTRKGPYGCRFLGLRGLDNGRV